MEVKAGDRILVESEKVGQATRTGIIEEVLAQNPPRYRVQWADGHTTVFIPTAGAAQIEVVEK
jgi:uncharacterized protein DUF1918